MTTCPNCGHVVPGPRQRPITARQHEVLHFIRGFVGAHSYAPSFEEIAAKFGYNSLATVHEHIGNLERKGWITRTPNEARSIALVELSDESPDSPPTQRTA
jgi:SOS-response transcriptional repressor LexA